jgi:hypothetical protein
MFMSPRRRPKRRSGLPAPFCLAAGLLFFSFQPFAQSSAASEPTGQNIFGLNGSFDNPDTIPDNVVKALISSKQASQTREWMRAKHDPDARHFFIAKKIHLATSSEDDFVVLGTIPGADCLQFWVVLGSVPRPRVVLFGSGNTIELLPGDRGKLSDLRIDWWAGNGYGWADEYRFNGSRYVRLRGLDTYWEVKKATANSQSSWVLRESHPSRSAATQ